MREHQAGTRVPSRPRRPAEGRRRDEAADPRVPLSSGALASLQRSVGNRAVHGMLQRQDDEAAGEQVRSVLRAPGAPLETGFRVHAEQFLGADFSHVRVHTGAAAAESAQAIGAHAYTSGSDIVFGSGQYDTTSTVGQRQLAHELTHVVQQRNGAVDGTAGAGGLYLSDPSDRFEQEAAAMGAAFAVQSATSHVDEDE